MATKTGFRSSRSARSAAYLSLFTLAAAAAVLAIAAGCSSSEAPAAGCTAGTTVACACSSGETGTQLCGSAACTCASPGAGATKDSGANGVTEDDSGTPSLDAGEHIGDGGRVTDGASPASLYTACALQGSFGWPCSIANAPDVDAAGQSAVLDPIDCTDPSYPYCFLGGQGSWCTAPCTLATVAATCNLEDAGCAPRTDTTCNAKGFCK